MPDQPLTITYCGVRRVLARMSGVDLSKASNGTVREWEARGLALIELFRGNRAEAERIMAPLAAAGAPKEEA